MTTQHIYDLYAEDVKHFVLGKVKDGMIADDLVQETFIKVHTKKQTLQDDSKLKSWLFSIARHTVMDYFRTSKPSRDLPENELVIEDSAPKEHDETDCLHGIIKSLPKKYRNPLFLSDIKGMKQTEVADQLNLPLPTVKSQIQRARKLIAQGYMDCCDLKMNEDGYLVGEIKDRPDCKICH